MALPPEGHGWGPALALGPASLVKTARSGVGRTGELFRAATWLMIVKIIWELKKIPVLLRMSGSQENCVLKVASRNGAAV